MELREVLHSPTTRLVIIIDIIDIVSSMIRLIGIWDSVEHQKKIKKHVLLIQPLFCNTCSRPRLLLPCRYTKNWQIEKSIYSLSPCPPPPPHLPYTGGELSNFPLIFTPRSRVRQTIDIHSTSPNPPVLPLTAHGSLPPPHRKHNPRASLLLWWAHPSVRSSSARSTNPFDPHRVTRLHGHNNLYHFARDDLHPCCSMHTSTCPE